MNLGMERRVYDWEKIEGELGYELPKSYKKCYEYMGAFGIDDYVYVISMFESDTEEGFEEYQKYVKYAYRELEEYLDENKRFTIGIGEKDWFPIGQTSNGDFLFCSDSYGVMITDSAFDEREEYRCGLQEFVCKYLNDDIEYKVIPEDLKGIEHDVVYGEQELGYLKR